MPKFISDEEMQKLEAAAPSQPEKKKVISDEEMAAMEAAAPDSALDKIADKAAAGLASGTAAGGEVLEGAADFGRGAVQGATLGFADEIAGAGEATWDAVKKAKLADWLQDYRKHQVESQTAFEAAKERSPWLYGSGELAGGVGAGLATGGAGLGVGAVNTLRGAAALGAATGLVQGVGGSHGNLDDAQGRAALAGDAIGGALMGGAVGGSMKYAGDKLAPLGKWAKDYAAKNIDESPLLRQMTRSFRKGAAGEAINDTTPIKSKLTRENDDAVRTLTDRFLGASEKLGKEVGDVYDAASAAGATVDLIQPVTKTVNDLTAASASKSLIDRDMTGKALDMLGFLQKKGAVDPKAARDLLPQIQNMIKNTDDEQLKKILIGLQDDVHAQTLVSVPGLDKANARFSGFRAAGPETIIGKGAPEYKGTWMGDMKHGDGKLLEGVEGLLESYTRPGASGLKSVRTGDRLLDNLQAYETANPGVLKSVGIDIGTLGKEIRDKADDFSIVRQALGIEPQSGSLSTFWGALGGGAETGRGQLIQKSNLLGRGVNKLQGSGVAKIGSKLYNLPDDVYGTLANGLKAVPGTKSLGEALERGLQNKDVSLKNAALFSILQNPKARLLISGEDFEK